MANKRAEGKVHIGWWTRVQRVRRLEAAAAAAGRTRTEALDEAVDDWADRHSAPTETTEE
jgi:hypothetical protein